MDWVRRNRDLLSSPVDELGGNRLALLIDVPERALLEWLEAAVAGDQEARRGASIYYGYWPLRLVTEGEVTRVQELSADGDHWQSEVSLAVTYWRSQSLTCDKSKSQFAPPRADQLAAISRGVLEGNPVEAVRYNAPSHMSGWYLTTDQYDGDVASLELKHLFHVSSARPDLIPYLALAPGHRFWAGTHPEVLFDPKVAAEDS